MAVSDVLVRKRVWNAKSKRWGDWQVVMRRSEVGRRVTRSGASLPTSASIALPLGGRLTLYLNLVDAPRQQVLIEELVDENPHLFRQYRIQGGPERRAHFLLHDRATDDDFATSSQPGYRYGRITMKARPLSLLPHLQTLAHEMQLTCGVPYWNIGIEYIYYRDNRDHMGYHADDDQGEDKILTVIIKSPPVERKVIIQKKTKGKSKNRQEGDEQYELSIAAGDAYDMDGVMQEHYVHGVPSSEGEPDGRIAIVMRHGTYREYAKDSGSELDSLDPLVVIPQTFGRMEGLVEGDSYTRERIRELGAHTSPQGGVSGNKTNGCDAIIVSGARRYGLGEDRFDELMYAATTRVGAGGIQTSMEAGTPIRVFRSSSAKQNPYRALQKKGQSTQYRYDGVYRVTRVSSFDKGGQPWRETPEKVSDPATAIIYQFQFERIEVGEDLSMNEKSVADLMMYSVRNGTIGSDGAEAARLATKTSNVASLPERKDDDSDEEWKPCASSMPLDQRKRAALPKRKRRAADQREGRASPSTRSNRASSPEDVDESALDERKPAALPRKRTRSKREF